ncbi:MAG: substrate-binding periplasmic protein [Desulfovibrionaceae bacterium]
MALLLALAALLPGSARAQRPVLVLADSNDLATEISARVLTEAYAHLGITVATRKIPLRRVDLVAGLGDIDGLVNRIDGMERYNPDLIRVSVPINHFVIRAHCVQDLQIPDWNSLRDKSVGIRLGSVFAEDITQSWKRVVALPDYDKLYALLAEGRLDVIVSSDLEGLRQAAHQRNDAIHSCGPPLKTMQLYHYLQKRHAALVPKITAVLRAMTDSGRIEEIREEALAELARPGYETWLGPDTP